MTDEELKARNIKLAEAEAKRMNEVPGDLEGYDCPICKNKGIVAIVQGTRMATVPCECMKTRSSLARLERSGLKDTLKTYTFKNFKAEKPWQQTMLEKAVNFAKNPEGWFFIGGQVGSGKTHLCTAIAGHLIRTGREVLYMRWVDDGIKLKACKNNDEEYAPMIDRYKGAEVLYIDDFLKTEQGKQPTTADVNLAFEILNYRYNNPKLITILSSEKSINDILGIDEAVGSRIFQRCGTNRCTVKRDRENNYRLGGLDNA